MNTDKAFDKNIANQYRLSIQVSLDGFSFLVLSEDSGDVISAKNTSIKISSHKLTARHFNDWVINEPLLSQAFKKVEILLFDEHFTLVPEEVDTGKLTDIFINPESDRKTFKTKITDPAASLHFGVNKELAELADSKFKTVEWTHPISVLLNHFQEEEKPNSGILMQSQNHFFLVIKKRTRLLLANCFKAEHTADLIYFLVNAFKQFEVSRNLTHLKVGATSGSAEPLKQLLSRYFPVISEFKPQDETASMNENSNQLHLFLAQKLS